MKSEVRRQSSKVASPWVMAVFQEVSRWRRVAASFC